MWYHMRNLVKKEEKMKKILVLFVFLLTVCSFAEEYNMKDIQIDQSGKKYYPVYDGIVMEGTNTFIMESDSGKLEQHWAKSICGLSSHYSIKKITATYNGTKLAETAKCYDSKGELLEEKKKEKKK